MRKYIELGTFMGLRFNANPNTIIYSMLLWAALSFSAYLFLELMPSIALLSGFAAMLLHWDSETWHHLGHAWAAKKTGYPMTGITYWWLLASSRYPKDEPELPAEIHIRRALGGPMASATLAFITGLAVLALRPNGGAVYFIAVFWFLDNFFVFTIGSLLPLRFTDGSTLLYWWPRRGQSN